jgi:hypothetical protein
MARRHAPRHYSQSPRQPATHNLSRCGVRNLCHGPLRREARWRQPAEADDLRPAEALLDTLELRLLSARSPSALRPPLDRVRQVPLPFPLPDRVPTIFASSAPAGF